MKKILGVTIWFVFIVLVSANIFLFCTSIKLSNQTHYYEEKSRDLHQKNLSLEEELSKISSLKYAQNIASKIDFTVFSMPEYIDRLEYAFKPEINEKYF